MVLVVRQAAVAQALVVLVVPRRAAQEVMAEVLADLEDWGVAQAVPPAPPVARRPAYPANVAVTRASAYAFPPICRVLYFTMIHAVAGTLGAGRTLTPTTPGDVARMMRAPPWRATTTPRWPPHEAAR